MTTALNCNPDEMRLWIAALRSGTYKQGQERLCALDTEGAPHWCCMGVACDIAVSNGIELGITDSHGSRSYNGDGAMMPIPVAEWLGLDARESGNDVIVLAAGLVGGFNDDVSAVDANDNLDWDFDMIADALERTYLPGDWAETEARRAAE